MSHLLGAALMTAAGLLKLFNIRGAWQRSGWHTFILSGTVLLSLSGTYHLLQFESVARKVLQRLDHAAIWVLIAGTFTSIHITSFSGPSRWIIPGVVWTASACGIVFRTIYFSVFPDWLELVLYLNIGWLGIITAVHLYRIHGRKTLRDLLAGGVFYSIGALVDAISTNPDDSFVQFGHGFFHIFVLLGIFAHFRLMLVLSNYHAIRFR